MKTHRRPISVFGSYTRVHKSLYDQRIEDSFRVKGAAENYLGLLGLSLKSDVPKGFDNDQKSLKPNEEICLFQAMHFLKYWINKSTSTSRKLRLIRMRTAIRNRIVCANIGLIYRCISLTSVRADRDSLIGAGHIALMDAAEQYNPYLGVRFSTYASVSIFRRFAREIHSKQLPIHDDMDPTEVVDERETFEEVDNRQFLITKLRNLLDAKSGVLTQEDIDILTLRFNLNHKNKGKMTLQDIASLRGKSKERIRQLQEDALQKLKAALGCVL